MRVICALAQALMSLLLPRHTKLKQEINEVLDAELIKQQAQHGTLNFKVSWFASLI